MVEPAPLGTGGAIRYAAQGITDTIVVFNGDVMTSVDVNAVVERHRSAKAMATIVLTPVDNPTAYGLVETDAEGRVTRFLEKPKADEITCDTINAGIYVLEPETFDRIPKDVAYSIERGYFPSLTERGETFVAYIDRGYWIDIGTPEKYIQVHRDMFDGRFDAGIYRGVDRQTPLVSPEARVDDGADAGSPLLRRCRRAHQAGRRGRARTPWSGAASWSTKARHLRNTILWPNTRIGQNAVLDGPIIGRNCHIGRNVSIKCSAVLGDKTTLTDYTHA